MEDGVLEALSLDKGDGDTEASIICGRVLLELAWEFGDTEGGAEGIGVGLGVSEGRAI